ncbi:MAG: phage portal protein [Verrucomicrobia bacterium]|nr:MAG: phage portal protein [Verrucomicrobiota bacterium]
MPAKFPTIFDARGHPAAYVPGGYQGAGTSRNRTYISAQVTDFRKELTAYTRTELVRKARFFKKNIGLVRGVCKSLVDHAIGPGVYPIPATADDEWNEHVWGWFWEVAKIGDVSGRMTLWETQRMRTAAKFFDGEIFTLLTTSRSGWPQYQLIRAHNCGDFDVDPADGWVDGVKVDAVNRPRAYRFRLRGGDRYSTVNASAIIHSYLLEEPDQVRGVTPLAAAINKLHDAMDALAFEMQAVKDLSRTARVITTESGEDEEPEKHFTSVEATGWEEGVSIKLEQLFGAEIARLKTGEKLESFGHDRPSPTFTGFLDYIGRDITTGTGFPYEFAWDPKGIPGPAVRFVLEKVRVACDEWRRNEIEDTLPFYTFAVARGIDLGEIPPRPDWWKVEWLPGAEDVTIDKGRESASAIANVKAALDNFKRYFARRGLWWKTELRQKAVEAAFIRDLAAEFGISEDRVHQLTANSGGLDSAAAPNTADSGSSDSTTTQQ